MCIARDRCDVYENGLHAVVAPSRPIEPPVRGFQCVYSHEERGKREPMT